MGTHVQWPCLAPSPALRPVYGAVRARVPVMVRDRVVGDAMAAIEIR